MLAILDYKAGNQTSVARALERIGAPAIVTASPEAAAACDGVIFPGVGAAPQAMAERRARGLDKALREALDRGRPLLGICLGCQVALERSAEGDAACLGIFPGSCEKFSPDWRDENGEPIKIPHMGWNSLSVKKKDRILENIPGDAEFYFVHSYFPRPPEELVIATSRHGREFCALYGREGAWLAQFHVEKSGMHGLRMLENFYKYCLEKRCSRGA